MNFELDTDMHLKCKAINMGEFRIILQNSNYKIIKDNKKIIKIETENVNIEKGDEITISNNGYDIKYIIRELSMYPKYPNIIFCKENVYNTTTLFILPLLFENKSLSSFINNKDGYLINSYFKCDFINKMHDNDLFLLLKYSTSERFKIQESLFIKNKHFVASHDIHKQYVLYEFKIPEEFSKDVNLLINGKYSKISEYSKKKICSFHGNTIDGMLINKVLYRSKELIKFYEDEFDCSMKDVELYKKISDEDVLTKDYLKL